LIIVHNTKWNVNKIITHQFSGTDAVFQIKWGSGDHTWLPYHKVIDLDALGDYFNVLGISEINQLKASRLQGMDIPDEDVQILGMALAKWKPSNDDLVDALSLRMTSHNNYQATEEVFKPSIGKEENQATTLALHPQHTHLTSLDCSMIHFSPTIQFYTLLHQQLLPVITGMSLHQVVLRNIQFSATSNAVHVHDLTTTNKWLQMVYEQVKQVWDINEALAKGINPLDIKFVVGFVQPARLDDASLSTS
jgi:hypothetical protein